MKRIDRIKQRHQYFEHLAQMRDEATLTREPDEWDLRDATQKLAQVGAKMAASRRGLLTR